MASSQSRATALWSDTMSFEDPDVEQQEALLDGQEDGDTRTPARLSFSTLLIVSYSAAGQDDRQNWNGQLSMDIAISLRVR